MTVETIKLRLESSTSFGGFQRRLSRFYPFVLKIMTPHSKPHTTTAYNTNFYRSILALTTLHSIIPRKKREKKKKKKKKNQKSKAEDGCGLLQDFAGGQEL